MPWSGKRHDAPRVLVVDDDSEIRDLLDDLLTGEGYNVLVAPDGADALPIALERAPDVILLDLRMPRMGGPDFCRAYRERGGQARIILVTAVPSATEEIARCHADDLIAKPFQIETVLSAVERQAARPS